MEGWIIRGRAKLKNIYEDFFNIDSMKDVEFAKEITENEIKKENFIVGFLSSIKQKMESGRK